jgi:hypothetical protein
MNREYRRVRLLFMQTLVLVLVGCFDGQSSERANTSDTDRGRSSLTEQDGEAATTLQGCSTRTWNGTQTVKHQGEPHVVRYSPLPPVQIELAFPALESAVDGSLDRAQAEMIQSWRETNSELTVYLERNGDRVRHDLRIDAHGPHFEPKHFELTVFVRGQAHLVKQGDLIPGTKWAVSKVSIGRRSWVIVPPSPNAPSDQLAGAILGWPNVNYVVLKEVD